jgi:hypothetical protein
MRILYDTFEIYKIMIVFFSYIIVTGFPLGKAAGAWSLLLTFI